MKRTARDVGDGSLLSDNPLAQSRVERELASFFAFHLFLRERALALGSFEDLLDTVVVLFRCRVELVRLLDVVFCFVSLVVLDAGVGP